MYPYFAMSLLFLSLAALAALDTSLVSLAVFQPFPGLRWVVVHVVTLGALTEFLFGAAPSLVAALRRQPSPKIRWDTWIVLNGGYVILFVGIPLMNGVLITAAGTLVFVAVGLLVAQLVQSGTRSAPAPESPGQPRAPEDEAAGAKFYIAGLAYVLVGILVGTGLWQGWAAPLRIAAPKEVHVHSNLWGFVALVYAGLLVDLFPRFAGRGLAMPRSVTPIFWLMVAGALGMVAGPWTGIDSLTVTGLVLHTAGTVWLLVDLIQPLARQRAAWSLPGLWHLLIAYLWFLLAVVVAPLVVVGSSTGAEVAGSGGPILIYGWILQVGYALIPYLFRRGFQPDRPGRLGGSWFSLLAINAGSLVYWLNLFLTPQAALLRGLAYLLWIVSLVPMLADLRAIVSRSAERIRELEALRFSH